MVRCNHDRTGDLDQARTLAFRAASQGDGLKEPNEHLIPGMPVLLVPREYFHDLYTLPLIECFSFFAWIQSSQAAIDRATDAASSVNRRG
jgi:hypothetical protein